MVIVVVVIVVGVVTVKTTLPIVRQGSISIFPFATARFYTRFMVLPVTRIKIYIFVAVAGLTNVPLVNSLCT